MILSVPWLAIGLALAAAMPASGLAAAPAVRAMEK